MDDRTEGTDLVIMLCGIKGHAGCAFDSEAETGTFSKNDFHEFRLSAKGSRLSAIGKGLKAKDENPQPLA
jgi:hypothetical protein